MFWRTAGSGARATARAKSGRSTFGSYGDIGALDPRGIKLIETIAFELKRGYNAVTIATILDKPERLKEQELEKWIRKAIRSSKQSGAPFWMIVHKRDAREIMLIMPTRLVSMLREVGALSKRPSPYAELHVKVAGKTRHLAFMRSQSFFRNVTRKHVKKIWRMFNE